MTVQISQRGKAYYHKARTLLRAAQTITDPAIAGLLKPLVDDHQRRAKKALHVGCGQGVRSIACSQPSAGDGTAAAVCVGRGKGRSESRWDHGYILATRVVASAWHSWARRGATTRLRETEATRFTKIYGSQKAVAAAFANVIQPSQNKGDFVSECFAYHCSPNLAV